MFVPGDAPPAATLSRDYSTKSDRNLQVSLTTLPEQATAGTRTQMTFHVDPVDGFEKYLGALHAFLLRKRVALPAGTIIHGVGPLASVLLLPAASSGTH